MSNRAEQLSDRAKRGSDSEAKLDSPSERRSRKGKNLPRKGKCPRGQFPSLDTRLSSSGDTFFFLIWRLFNHKSMPLLGCHLWMPPFYRVLQIALASFIMENFASSKFQSKKKPMGPVILENVIYEWPPSWTSLMDAPGHLMLEMDTRWRFMLLM